MRPERLLKLGEVAAVVHEPQHPAEDGREAVWQPVDGAEVEHAEPPAGKQPEVARVRIGVRPARIIPAPSAAGAAPAFSTETRMPFLRPGLPERIAGVS